MKKPTTPPRKPGRPAAATVQRDQLLDVATNLFASQGIQATSLRAIADQAGVTPALLNYYFGGKDGLVEAMIEQRFLPLVSSAAEQLEAAGDDPQVLVETFIRHMSHNVALHPWVSQLWVREILCEGGALRERLLPRVVPLIPLLLAQRFAEAQARGALNADLDPRLLVVSLIGLTMLPLAAAPIWRGVFANPQIGDEALINHTLALLKGGMEP